jgi:selenocysteine lyase/cysteine desulfurase
LKVAAISAGSNITGTLVDVDRIAVLCHKYGTLATFDYAAVMPYTSINMNGMTESYGHIDPIDIKDQGLAYKDAIYFSPHKLMGGP